MTRIVSFVVIVLLIGFGFSWLADRPGILAITWQGQLIEMSLMVAALKTIGRGGAAPRPQVTAAEDGWEEF